MANSEFPLINNKNDKEIEDVIDARKRIGQYDICKNSKIPPNCPCRRPWSAPVSGIFNESSGILVDDYAMWISEGDICNPIESGMLNVGPTDSEVTVVRVKREGLRYKTRENKWNLHDDAVPGDGTHLGESPSLVNLVTLVGQSLQSYENKTDDYNEYLVPLSSWDPSDNPYQLPESTESELSTKTTCVEQSNQPKYHTLKSDIEVRHGLARKITNFLRKRCTRHQRNSTYDSARKNGKSSEDVGQRDDYE